jgi:beta-lactamase superfamily II metal-dependent hydrolase
MKRTARRPARSSRTPRRAAAADITVRMYNVGFGDCFLLSFPAPDRPRKVLIDCGVHAAGPPKPVPFADVVKALHADVVEPDGPRIDVVVCSHRHRDHVLGFEDTALWRDVRVDEVWMPWTEDPKDAEARKIREAQAKKAKDLALALKMMLAIGRIDQAGFDRIQAVVANSDLTNAKAMDTLHTGFAGDPDRRYLPEKLRDGKALARTIDTLALPGVRVHVLGPSRSRDVIRDMNPPSDESFLRLARSAEGGALDGPPVSLADWALSPAGSELRAWFEKRYADAKALPDEPSFASPPRSPEYAAAWLRVADIRWSDIEKLDELTEDDALLAAAAIDQAVNGTSLMLAFEMGGALLLFPGDAQWGTWNEALRDPEWSRLLARLSFLKVGHHGSHNATPQSFVKLLAGGRAVAMVSTRETKRYEDIPRKPLLTALAQATSALARSDEPAVSAPFRRVSPVAIETTIAT